MCGSCDTYVRQLRRLTISASFRLKWGRPGPGLGAGSGRVGSGGGQRPGRALADGGRVVGNLVASWSINSARDLAWQNALLLWALRDEPVARGLFLDGLAAQVALASRLLLVAV